MRPVSKVQARLILAKKPKLTLAMANALRLIASRGGVRFVPGHKTGIALRTVWRLIDAGLCRRDARDPDFVRVCGPAGG